MSSETRPLNPCVHDVRYGWRYQIGPWVQEGFRVVVPDMLGYGGTDKPQEVGEYTTKRLCADLVAILDLIGLQTIVRIKCIIHGTDQSPKRSSLGMIGALLLRAGLPSGILTA